jgi:hypothetical protein
MKKSNFLNNNAPLILGGVFVAAIAITGGKGIRNLFDSISNLINDPIGLEEAEKEQTETGQREVEASKTKEGQTAIEIHNEISQFKILFQEYDLWPIFAKIENFNAVNAAYLSIYKKSMNQSLSEKLRAIDVQRLIKMASSLNFEIIKNPTIYYEETRGNIAEKNATISGKVRKNFDFLEYSDSWFSENVYCLGLVWNGKNIFVNIDNLKNG